MRQIRDLLGKAVLVAAGMLAATLPACAQEEAGDSVAGGQDSTLALPEGMQTREMDSLLHSWAVRGNLAVGEDCHTTGEVVTYSPEVYQSRLRRLPNVVDMPYNEVVRKYIDLYGGRLRRSVSVMLGAFNFYVPIFEEALESYQVPLELKYLPVIESALNPGATSRVGAAGLWQFMVTTGKQYGLEVTSLVDERRDPVKASYAAARYLRDLYDIFGDWTLVIASYNCGPNNVSKAIKRAGGARDYWAIYSYLPRETQGYVPAFIAANYIMNYYCDHNICPVKTTLPQATDTLVVTRDVRMERIEQMCGIAHDELRGLNPQYRTSLIPGEARPCILRMPVDKVNAFIEAGDSIYVQPGERVQVVEVAVAEPRPKAARHPRTRTVRVRKGDTLGAIARRNNTTVAKIKRLNRMRGTRINPGQRIRVR